MADTLHSDILDNGLSALANAENLYICSDRPSTFLEASSTYKLGTKVTPTIGVPSARTPNGRKATVSAITDGIVNSTGSAGFYALTDDSASKLLATGSLSAVQAVIEGQVFTLTSFEIGIPDPV